MEYTKLDKKLQDQYSELLKNQVPNKVEIYYHNKLLKHHSIGQRASALILFILMQSDNDIILIDQPEDDLDNKIIYDEVITAIKKKKQKMQFVFATHNANIAVGTLPYISILRTHENGVYKTYIGNPFYDELRNINDETDTKNWTQESMHTLEGGKNAFYDRKDIYESGK